MAVLLWFSFIVLQRRRVCIRSDGLQKLVILVICGTYFQEAVGHHPGGKGSGKRGSLVTSSRLKQHGFGLRRVYFASRHDEVIQVIVSRLIQIAEIAIAGKLILAGNSTNGQNIREARRKGQLLFSGVAGGGHNERARVSLRQLFYNVLKDC